MNKSLDDRLLPDGYYRDAENIKVSSTEDSDSGAAQNYLGNTKVLDINTLLVEEGFTDQGDELFPVGSVTDTRNNSIYWLITSPTYDIVAQYYESDQSESSGRLVLVETKSSFSLMNFDESNLITGINIIDNMLFFTDGINSPKRIMVDDTYRDSNITEDTVNVILKPPISSPDIRLVYDDEIAENLIDDKFLRFAYRYIYDNNEVSALSPFSKTAFEADRFKFDFISGQNEAMRNKANKVVIYIDTGGDRVKEVEVVMKDSRNTNAVIVGTIEIDDSMPQFIEYEFKNNKVFRVLPDAQVNRLFDNVPKSAYAQDVIGRRIVYGNYRQFFNIKTANGETIKPKLQLKSESSSITEGESYETIKSGRDYQVGIAYLDRFGRMSTVLESPNNTVNIPITRAKEKNKLVLNISSRVPDFADYYRLFIKQNRGTYYNVIPISFYKDGAFIYFQVAKYDVDKVPVGSYIYIKSTFSGEGPVDKKFKILEAEIKKKDFLGEQKEVGQDEGFYIKLKIDDQSVFPENSYTNYKFSSIGSTASAKFPKKQTVKAALDFTASFGSSKSHVEDPIFYGEGYNKLSVQRTSTRYNYGRDQRIILDITGPRKFSYRHYDSSVYIQKDVDMKGFSTGGNFIQIGDGTTTYTLAIIKWHDTNDYTVGDRFVLNCRGTVANMFGNAINYVQPKRTDGGFAAVKSDIDINAGTIIKLRIKDGYDQKEMKFISSNSYKNLEEWFWEEQIYSGRFSQFDGSGRDIGARTVFFRRGFLLNKTFDDQDICYLNATGSRVGEIVMFIKGQNSSDSSQREFIFFSISVSTPESLCVLETEGTPQQEEFYYELPITYPVWNYTSNIKLHDTTVAGDTRQEINSDAVLTIQDFNAITFGNGVESSVIEDIFNGPELLPSPRASAAIDRYEEVNAENSLTYSGVYNQSSSTNDLNEFNLSLANFKALDREYGSVQKLYSRNSDLMVFQENKVSKVLFEKNLLSDAVGGGSIVSVPEVLGKSIPFPGEFGISRNPESFAKWGNDIFFTDEKRGSVINLSSQGGIEEISTYGMRSYFRDLFDDIAGKQKLGAFDPNDFKYVLSWTDIDAFVCEFDVSGDLIEVSGDAFTDGVLFTIKSNSDWNIEVAQTGSWLTLNTTSGSGDAVIKGSVTDNIGALSEREATITITYCNGRTKNIVFIQSKDKKKKVTDHVTGDKKNDGAKSVSPSYDSPSGGYQGGRTPIDNGGKYYAYEPIEGFLGSNGVPDSGETVDIIADTSFEDVDGTPLKPFNPDLGNKMYYLDTDTVYTADQGDAMRAAATEVTPVLVGSQYKGSFTYNAVGDYLYLLTDYTNNLDMSTSVTNIPTSGTDLPEAINLNNSDDIGRYTITYSSTSTNIRFVVENAAGAILHDTGFISTPSAQTIDIVKTSLGSDVIKVYAPEASQSYDISLSAVTLTAFSISDSGYETASEACSSSTTEIAYHNGDTVLPELADIVYASSDGSSVFAGGSLYYEIGSSAYVIDDNGAVVDEESCTCSEVALPVVDQEDLYINEGEDISIFLSATNNPTSFSAAGNCREYEFFGGSTGAVFQAQDCTTGLLKQFSLSVNQELTACFFIGSVSKIGGANDATFTDVGGCVTNAIPDGLTFSESTGQLQGSPLESGRFEFTVNATNCFGTSSDATFNIIVKPEKAPNTEFQIDTSNPQTSSSNACAIGSPSYSTMYHNGILEYPVIYDMIYSDPEGLNLYNGNNQWFLTESGVALLIDADGIVIDTFLCGVSAPTPPLYSSVSLAFGSSSSNSCSNTTFTTYYYDGTFGVNPGNLYADSMGAGLAPAGWYKYDTGGGFITFEWDGTSWGSPIDCP